MHITVLTVSNIEIPNRVTVFPYNTDTITTEQILEDIAQTLGDSFTVPGTIMKFLDKSIAQAQEKRFPIFYKLATKNSLRFAIKSQEVL